MRIVNIGIDKGLVGGRVLGDTINRHIEYGKFLDSLDVIAYTHISDGLTNDFVMAKNVVGHPTNSHNKAMFFFDAIRVFKKIISNRPVDIVVCQDPFVPGLIGWWLKKKYGVKLQINFHGDFWDNKNWLSERKINRLFLWISYFTVRHADALRVMSEGQKQKLLRHGISEKIIRVISTPVDLKKFNDVAQYPKIEHSEKVILHIGRDDEVKDYGTLMRAFFEVKKSHSNIVLWQAGAGDLLLRAVGQNTLPEDIKSWGSVGHDMIVRLCLSCDIFVLSSTSESFGKALIEAIACAKPVVSTATTGAQEIIEDGKNGYLIPDGD